MASKLDRIEQLAKAAKNGNKNATSELVVLFTPLIYKISKQIYLRYGRMFPMIEIIRQAKCFLVYLTISIYKPDGKAHYPHFIKKSLHAQLVQLYRPMFTNTIKDIPIGNVEYKIHITSDQVCEGERIEICDKVVEYIETNLNEREKDIWNNIISNIPRNDIARRYGVSFTRMKVIHHKIIKKLKKYLHEMGIDGTNDI
jgi:hypothetical protein